MKLYLEGLKREFWERCVVAMLSGPSFGIVGPEVMAECADEMLLEWHKRFDPAVQSQTTEQQTEQGGKGLNG